MQKCGGNSLVLGQTNHIGTSTHLIGPRATGEHNYWTNPVNRRSHRRPDQITVFDSVGAEAVRDAQIFFNISKVRSCALPWLNVMG